MSDEVLRAMQMTAGNQAVGRAIAEGRIAPVVPSEGAPVRPADAGQPEPDGGDPPAPDDDRS